MRHAVQGHLLKPRPFLQIPGPNPIVVRGAKGECDDGVSIEACDVLKDHDTYYLYSGISQLTSSASALRPRSSLTPPAVRQVSS
jgi:hypothetical protein